MRQLRANISRRRMGAATAALLALSASCTSETPSVIDAQGPAEHGIVSLWWLMLALSIIVVALIVFMLIGGIVRSRRAGEGVDDARWGEPFIVIVGVVISAVVLVTVFVLSLREMRANAEQGKRTSLQVTVIGHDWWWEARYPNGGITANEIHIPAKERVRIELVSDDVIHSFWVPQLAPKTDLIPGKRNVMWIEASRPGRYRGQCAEFCGFQHANMAFFVVAERRAKFDSWQRTIARPARSPTTAQASRGRQVFLSSTCAGCHTIRGTSADGDDGPDLTHIASRRTIASGTITNTPDNLGLWISDPQGIKQGVSMPPAHLSDADLEALIVYLESLR